MTLKMTASDVLEIKPGMWEFDVPPHQVRHFGNAGHAIGPQSVLLFRSYDFDAEKRHLHFKLEDVSPINVGTTTKVLGIGFCEKRVDDVPTSGVATSDSLGPGDQEFLRLAKSDLSKATAKLAEQLLLQVRQTSPGDLKRGQSRNFSETPDNYWYVIVQPRIDELSITVRGSVDHFKPVARLMIKDDRGNTRFKVKNKHDLPAALEIISHAVRKG